MNKHDLDISRELARSQLDLLAGKPSTPEVAMQRANSMVFIYLVDTLRWFFESFLTLYRMRGR